MNLKDKLTNQIFIGKALRGDLHDNSGQRQFDRWFNNFLMFKFCGGMAIISGPIIRSYDSLGIENAQILGNSIQADYLVLGALFALKTARLGRGQQDWDIMAVRRNVKRDITTVGDLMFRSRTKISELLQHAS